MPDIACVPPIDACGIENPDQPGHYCDVEIGHRFWHECEHRQWRRDVEFELACALYVRHFTVAYTEAPEIPSQAVVWAACAPADSHWRAMARTALHMIGEPA